MKLNTADDYLNGIKLKNRVVLAKAISLVESKNAKHQNIARELIRKILPLTGNAKRIGISGIPGVGKSTFIEKFGMSLIEKNHTVAVLAIDPSSQNTGGSILGDKTRMQELSSHPNAFVRPSPSGDKLGGITAKTREALLLCDAFGFDYIFIETVGVGQSEISVKYIADMFVLLMQPGAGDELQGIKRGIIEVSDLVLINKADGVSKTLAETSLHNYQKSVHIIQASNKWQAKVLLCSAIQKMGFPEIYANIQDFYQHFDYTLRDRQLKNWMEDLLLEQFYARLRKLDVEKIIDDVKSGKIDMISASTELFEKVMK